MLDILGIHNRMKKITNIFDSIPDNLDEEVFDLLIQNRNIMIERIISKGQSSPKSGWYNQNKDEWVIVLRGEALISFENDDDVNLKAGDHIHIPAFTKHKVKWTDSGTETIWLAVFF